jgi:hypothetical protein
VQRLPDSSTPQAVRCGPVTTCVPVVTLRHMITVAAVVACALLAGLVVFQCLLVAGRPLGRFAWGGQHEVLPRTLRASSAVSMVIYVLIAWFVWRAATEPEDAEPWIWLLTGFFGLGVVMNAASRSRPERFVMTPIVLVLAVSCLLIALG